MATMTLWLRRTLVRPEQYGAHRIRYVVTICDHIIPKYKMFKVTICDLEKL